MSSGFGEDRMIRLGDALEEFYTQELAKAAQEGRTLPDQITRED